MPTLSLTGCYLDYCLCVCYFFVNFVLLFIQIPLSWLSVFNVSLKWTLHFQLKRKLLTHSWLSCNWRDAISLYSLTFSLSTQFYVSFDYNQSFLHLQTHKHNCSPKLNIVPLVQKTTIQDQFTWFYLCILY